MTHHNSTFPRRDAFGAGADRADGDRFVDRHLGPREADQDEMLQVVGYASLDALADAVVPRSIRLDHALDLPPALTEQEALGTLRELAAQNELWRSYIGAGYYGTITPPVIQRNIFENPGWYTQYTPYQPEISQGRLEALLIYQTMVAELTGFPLANASLLDEATAAAEAMTMCWAISQRKRQRFFVDEDCHPQTLAVVRTRAKPLGIIVEVGDAAGLDPAARDDLFGILVQYPASSGRVVDHESLLGRARAAGVLTAVATDLLALTLLRPPGELGADIALGSSQRFGVPIGYGGPHAAFFATREEHKRLMPGRIIGASKDARGRLAYRLALQTREQHIRREKATSNICTAQVLLAIAAAMYAVYHGPRGLRRIAERVHRRTAALAEGLRRLGFDLGDAASSNGATFFDTLRVNAGERRDAVLRAAAAQRINLRSYDDGRSVGVSLDETTSAADVETLVAVFAAAAAKTPVAPAELAATAPRGIPESLVRSGECLRHEVFSRHHSEHQLTRYLQQLQNRDLSLTTSMIPLGSCTMKLNPTAAMMPITWPELTGLHPFAPVEQARGYAALIAQLARWLAEITGFSAISFQPNAGAQGEYTGLLVIRAYHEQRGETRRDVCLIPVSAHGTNPASAVLAGMRVVTVACDERGNIDVADLEAKAAQHAATLGALMVTYPSTHGVFEEPIRRICEIVHAHGGQVYLDGANMNAQVGLCRPAEIGADVCHLNLHKTFAIPHGGGGPGMGPIGVAAHLAPFLPGHPLVRAGGEHPLGTVSAAPYGSPSILPISWAYIAMMGAAGLRRASQTAILNANYLACRVGEHFPVLYTGESGLVAHEFIVDMRDLKKRAGVTVDDVAKRLMDYGFHAPTMSFPVPGTMMIEPTESEDKAELDRFCLAMATIREEIRAIEEGAMDRAVNPLTQAPHTAEEVSADTWERPYGREQAAYPAPWLRCNKFWPPVARVDNAYGDRNLVALLPAPECA